MIALLLLACTCQTSPPPDVPDVDRGSVQANTCFGDAGGARLTLELTAGQRVAGTWSAPDGTQRSLSGLRDGRILQFEGARGELLGRAVAWEDGDGKRLLQRIGCGGLGASTSTVRGICDASAAVSWRGWRIVADDEHNVLRFFAPDARDAEARIDLQALIPGVGEDEADLEGMALDGDRLWLVGSHDSGKKKAPKPARALLTALDLREGSSGPEATLVDAWPGLRDAMAADPRWAPMLEASVGRTSKDVQGFSVEGLALDPAGVHTGGNPGLLLGLRAPVIDGMALVLPLTPGPDGARVWALGDPIRLDLGGDGVRSLERAGEGWKGISGSPTAGGTFRSFTWSEPVRSADGAAEPGAVVQGPAPAGLSPEALWDEAGVWWVLSDDGNEDVDGAPCKQAPEAKRSARLAPLAR